MMQILVGTAFPAKREVETDVFNCEDGDDAVA
jgi:hypothetical protein